MACSGAHCTNHDTGTTTCVGHRPACAANQLFIPSAGFGVQGGDITAADVEQLRSKLRSEVALYNVNYSARAVATVTLREGSAWSVGTAIDDSDPNNLHLMGVDTPEPPGPGTPTMTKNPGDDVLATDWGTNIADLYETIRTDCICNANCDCNAICA